MKKISLIITFFLFSLVHYGQIVADHTVVDKYDDIPQYYIDLVKKMRFVIAGESHSLAYNSGLSDLKLINPVYDVRWTYDGIPEAYTAEHLRTGNIMWGDVNHETGWISNSYGEEDWFTTATAIGRTKAGITYCNVNNFIISALGFGWCYDGDYMDMTDYLAATQQYVDYCKDNNYSTKIFFTTGPIDALNGIGERGYNKYLAYESIRNYVKANSTRILFDFADILSYDNGNPVQSTTTWNGYTYPTITLANGTPAGPSHISEVGELRLGKAIWWMLARIAGWDGKSISTDTSEVREDSSKVFVENRGERIVVDTNDKFFNGQLDLYSLQGNLLSRKEIYENLNYIDTSQLPSGFYLVVLSKDRSREVKKVVLMH